MNAEVRKNCRKTLVGTVVSRSGDKTVKVAYSYKIPHPVYKKEIKRKTILYVHDEENKCRVGDLVSVFATRPLSKLKRWRVADVVSSVVNVVEVI